jgi:hypothetical protein
MGDKNGYENRYELMILVKLLFMLITLLCNLFDAVLLLSNLESINIKKHFI